MNVTLSVPPAMGDSLAALVEQEGIPLAIVSDGDGAVRVVDAEPGRQCDPATLCAGGWITCPAAFAMATRLGIDRPQMGRLLDALKIKVRGCQLGLFG